MYELRPYQEEARQAVLAEWAGGHQRTLLVLPTGAGKTIVFAAIAQNQTSQGHRVLIMAHRDELLQQASDKLYKATELETVLEKANSTCLGSDIPVVVGSVQSLMQPGRLRKFPADYFDDIIVDEAHHCLSDSYQRVLTHFPNANVLGVTATPDRGDKRTLAEYFDSMAYEYLITDAVKEQYLCPLHTIQVSLKIDIRDVRISQGDFFAGDIGCALEPYLEEIAEEMLHYCDGRKTVVFLPLIAISQEFCEILKTHGFRAAEVNGNSPDRKEILEDFERGVYDVLCNAMLLTEGWDCPSVDCIVVLRPTKIRSLYQQMVGRGMRTAPGKKNLLLLDFLWLSQKHDLCRPSCLISESDEITAKVNAMIENGEEVDLLEAKEAAKRDIIEEKRRALAKQLAKTSQVKAPPEPRVQQQLDKLSTALSLSEEELANYEPTYKWEEDPPTEKQYATLEKFGVNVMSIDSKGYATMLIGKLFKRMNEHLSTYKQIQFLEKKGFRNVDAWTFEEAHNMMSQISANHWRVPRWITPDVYVPQRDRRNDNIDAQH